MNVATRTRLDVIPLSKHIGAEIRGIDLRASLDPDTIRDIYRAWLDHVVLVFRNQNFTQQDLLRVTEYFGETAPLTRPPKFFPKGYARLLPNIMMISNIRENGETIGALPDGEMNFHHDQIHAEVPHKGTLLYSLEVPSYGGDTLFADQYAAYDGLSSSLKRQVEGLVALHHYGNRDDLNQTSRTVASVLTEQQEKKVTWVRHPVARRHPITGRTALYAVSGSSFGIEGMPQDEAINLLDELKRHATQQKYQCRLKYGVGDVVVWDNASLLHSATLIDPDDPRTLWRITVKEERRS